MIEVFKWVKGFNKGDVGKILTISRQDRTRNNRFKLEKCRFNKEIGRNWSTNRVVDDWKRFSQQVVSAQTIGSFKRRLNDFMDGDERWVTIFYKHCKAHNSISPKQRLKWN